MHKIAIKVSKLYSKLLKNLDVVIIAGFSPLCRAGNYSVALSIHPVFIHLNRVFGLLPINYTLGTGIKKSLLVATKRSVSVESSIYQCYFMFSKNKEKR